MRWLVLAGAAVLWLAGCRKTTQPPVVSEMSIADSADQVIFDGRFFATQNGVKRGELMADTIFVFNDRSVFVMRKVRGVFNTETGTPNGTLSGDRGTYDRRTQILDGFGNVVVTSTDGKRLTSNHLRYSQLKNEVSSDSAYTYVENGEIQRGIGFVSDPNLTTFRCLRACGGEAMVPLNTLPRP